jgi:capsular polysaccharide biosynthesis protein
MFDAVATASATDAAGLLPMRMLGVGFDDTETRRRFSPCTLSPDVANRRMRDVTLLPVLGLVLQDGRIVESTRYAVTAREEQTAMTVLARPHLRLDGPAYASRRLFSGINRYCNNYHHIIAQVVPAIAGYAAEPGFADGILLLAEPGPVLRRALALTGALVGSDAPEILPIEPMVPVDAADLTVSSLLVGSDDLSLFALSVFDRMIEAIAPSDAADSPEMIYVWRADASHRPMRNEDELVERLICHGVTPVLLATLSLDEQIRLFRNARLVIGPHGAGLTNVVFGTPGAVLYELLPQHYRNPCMSRLAQLRGVHYWADAYPSEAAPGLWHHHVPWSVDLAAVERRLAEIMAVHGLG